MSHFKFVSTINAAEEGCTHFLVSGNRRLRLGHTGFEKGQHIEPSPLLLQASEQRATLTRAQLSGGFRATHPKVSDPNGTGTGWERSRGSGAAPGRLEGPSGARDPLPQGPPLPQASPQLTPGEGAAGGQHGDPGGDPSTLCGGLAGAQGAPRSSGASHRGDVLVTDTSVLCSSVCRK